MLLEERGENWEFKNLEILFFLRIRLQFPFVLAVLVYKLELSEINIGG